MTANNARIIGDRIGDLISVEDPATTDSRGFLRIRVTINSSRPLPLGFWLPKGMSGKLWIIFKFQGIRRFCYRCGRLGHTDKRNKPCTYPLCPRIVRDSLTYGPGLCADDVKGPTPLFPAHPVKWRRPLGLDVKENHWRRMVEKEDGGLYELGRVKPANSGTNPELM